MANSYATAPRAATGYQKPPPGYGVGYVMPVVPRQILPDDYEKWYTEYTPTNRMLLALRSGISREVNWALERMCRLVASHNDQFILKSIPGLTDILLEWPEWYVQRGAKECNHGTVFSSPPESARKRRHALEAMFILRNASLNEPNAQHLASHSRTRLLLYNALRDLKADSDPNAEFLLHVVDLLHSVINSLPQPAPDPLSARALVPPLEDLADSPNDRTMIITALRTLTLILTAPQNAVHLTSTSPALSASIRYLPLLSDTALITACLDYLYTHLSHPPMAKAFLFHSNMPSTLKLLATLLLREQQEEMTSVDMLPEPVRTAPAVTVTKRQHELSNEELDKIAATAEPERSYDWMRALFVASDAEEMTQVDFWSLYRDTFGQRQETHQLLTAADVIKNVSHVFPTAQAMVLPGAQPRFVIRGITRRMVDVTEERFKCHWSRMTCPSSNFQSPNELWSHVLEHLAELEGSEIPCQWSTCSFVAPSLAAIRTHVSTHIPTPEPPTRHPSQLENVTLPTTPYPHPSAKPTARPPPPPPNPQVVFPSPSSDPPSTSLTALLIIRVLFRTSFAATDAAPRADEDHFGFPGIVEEDTEEELRDEEEDAKGQRRGRKAFIGVRKLLEDVRVRDDALMAWIGEIIDVSMEGKPANV